MWKDEWKAYAFRLAWPLIGILAVAVAVCVIGSRQAERDAPPPATLRSR